MDELTRLKVEAAAFRGLVDHLRKRSDVQNIDIMNTAGFCRNCLAKWYRAAAEHYGTAMTYEEAQQKIYGMPISDWKARHHQPATPAQERTFEETKPKHAKIGVIE